MSVLLFLFISYALLSASLVPVFRKAGVNPGRALMPGVNFVEMAKLVGRKPIHALWLLVPIVNLFIFVGLCVDLVRSFGRYRLRDSALALVYAPAIFYWIGVSKNDSYVGPILMEQEAYSEKIQEARSKGHTQKVERLIRNNPYHKTVFREWIEAIFFAVFAAAFIRMFLIEAYKIPTTSMEGSLLQGDQLFISKIHYGMRTPQTIAMLPLLHNQIPGLNKESYLEEPSIPSIRFPALEKIDNMDLIVFNYPEGDSVYLYPGRTFSVHDIRRNPGLGQQIKRMGLPLITRPVDKRDHYVKRAVGTPGDTLRIIDKQLYINGEAMRNPKDMQYAYWVSSAKGVNEKALHRLGINVSDGQKMDGGYLLHLSQTELEAVQKLGSDIRIQAYVPEPGPLFPYTGNKWTIDNYGPVWIPKKGTTINLDPSSIAAYERIIGVYEGNDLEIKGDHIFINGKESRSYTFKMDYYFAIGDNRHNSEDSRVWGFIPEDHIVGKPLFVWFSSTHNNLFKNGINWERLFMRTNKL